jgi:hypothetical protein
MRTTYIVLMNTWDDALRTLTATLLKKKCDESVQRKWLRDTVATAAVPPSVPWDHLDPHHCAAAFERARPRTAQSYMAHLTDSWCALAAAAIADEDDADMEAAAAAAGPNNTEKKDRGTVRRRRLIAWLLCRIDLPRMDRLLARASFIALLVQLAERRAADADWIVAEVAAHITHRHARGDSSSGGGAPSPTGGGGGGGAAAVQGGEWTTITFARRTNADGTSSTSTTTRSAPAPQRCCPCCRGRRSAVDQFLRALIIAAAPQQRKRNSPGGAALLRAARQTWPTQTTDELAALSILLRPRHWRSVQQQQQQQQHAIPSWPIRPRLGAMWCGVCE